MTEKELAVIVQAIGPIVREAVEKAVSEANTKIAVLESQQKTLSDARDRVLMLEAKSTAPASVVDLAPVLERLSAAEVRLTEVDKYAARIEGYTSFLQRDTAALSERIAVVETRPPQPGPPGEPGQPGKDGEPGKDGLAGLSYEGVYQDGKSYEIGNLVTFAGSSWHCNEPTTTKPGDGSKAWTLMVKRGRDGKDGVNGRDWNPVVKAG